MRKLHAFSTKFLFKKIHSKVRKTVTSLLKAEFTRVFSSPLDDIMISSLKVAIE